MHDGDALKSIDRNSEEKTLQVLIIEPYYGGSHKHFLDGLIENLPFQFTLMTLPARKWKWRMRLSAPYFAEKLAKTKQKCDRILCSTFLDVATFRGLAPKWVREVPLLTYFHENQFAYPVRHEDKRDFHFGLTNLTTALASDRIAFNSRYNLESFLTGFESVLEHSYDLEINRLETKVRDNAKILSPGLDFSTLDRQERKSASPESPPVIVWNHRWEHDKNPRKFFRALERLKECGIPFRLMVLGQRFKEAPKVFSLARQRFQKEIVHFGYAKKRDDYLRLLSQGDIVVSTAKHEFFGMAVIEAVRAGCHPILPRRLTYPELFPERYLYSEGELFLRMRRELESFSRLETREIQQLTDKFSWDQLKKPYQEWIGTASAPTREGSREPGAL